MMKREMRDQYSMSRFWNIIEAALEYFISIMVSGAFLARVTGRLGFSDSLTGILSSFFSMGCVFQLGAIFIFRRKKRVKNTVLLMEGICELLFCFVYLFPLFPMSSGMKTILFVGLFFVAYILRNMLMSPKSNWMISLVSDETRGVFTAKKEMVSLMGGMIFTYAMGSLIDWLEASGDENLAFLVGAASMFVLLGLHLGCMLLIKEKPREISENKPLFATIRELMKDKPLMQILIIVSIWNIAYYCAYPFYGAYQINELGFSMTYVSILSIAYSIVRTLFSPTMGRIADKKSFRYMSFVCFCVALGAFFVNCFTVPENGKIFYGIYFCLHAISMAGINSAQTNMVYDQVKGENRQNALALILAFSGLIGFISTCLMSPVVDLIQKNGNQVLGIPMYAQQFVSGVACVIMVILLIYMKKTGLEKKEENA